METRDTEAPAGPLIGYAARGRDGERLGAVVLDIRGSFPRHRLVIEHGPWLLRRAHVVPHARIVHVDPSAHLVTLDISRADLRELPRW